MSRGTERIPLIAAGAVLLLVALAALVGGGTLVGIDAAKADGEGFYASGPHPLHTPTQALVARRLAVGTDGPDALFRQGRLGTLRVSATGTAAKPVFVGIARQGRVDRYLRGAAYDEVRDFELSPFSVALRRHPGVGRAARPAGERLWARSAVGAGRQTLRWDVREGDWAVVVMNADGSPGVTTRVGVGAKLPWLLWLGVGLLAGGAILAAGGGALIVTGSRARRSVASAA